MEIAELPAEKQDAYLKSHGGSLLQSSLWQKMKAPEWQGRRFAVMEGEEIRGCASLLLRSFKGLVKIAYVPRGFACDYADKEVVQCMVEECLRIAREEKCASLIVEPPVARGQAAVLGEMGLSVLEEELPLFQPHYDSIVDISMPYEDYLKSLNKNMQREVRRFADFKLTCVRNDPSLLEEYCRINAETEKRQGVHLRDKAYFEEMYQIFSEADALDFLMIKFCKGEYSRSLQERLVKLSEIRAEAQEERASCDPTRKKYQQLGNRIRESETEAAALEKRQQEMAGLPEEVYLSGTFVIFFGDTAYYLYACSSDALRFLRPSLFMNLEAIQDAQKRGCRYYNLGGVLHLEQDDGLMEFKRLLNGQLFAYENIYYKALNPLAHKTFFALLKQRKKKAEKEERNARGAS